MLKYVKSSKKLNKFPHLPAPMLARMDPRCDIKQGNLHKFEFDFKFTSESRTAVFQIHRAVGGSSYQSRPLFKKSPMNHRLTFLRFDEWTE